jgi:hypothetical protein
MNWIAPNLSIQNTKRDMGCLVLNIQHWSLSEKSLHKQPQKKRSTIRSITDQTKRPKSSSASREAKWSKTFIDPSISLNLEPNGCIEIHNRNSAEDKMNWIATSLDIQDTIPRKWLPRNWIATNQIGPFNSETSPNPDRRPDYGEAAKIRRTCRASLKPLRTRIEGQIMKKQQKSVALVEHLICKVLDTKLMADGIDLEIDMDAVTQTAQVSGLTT